MTLEQQATQAIRTVPKDKLQILIEFAHFLSLPNRSVNMDADKTKADQKRSILGRAKDKIWMAEDFDETPECFKEYI